MGSFSYYNQLRALELSLCQSACSPGVNGYLQGPYFQPAVPEGHMQLWGMYMEIHHELEPVVIHDINELLI